MTFGRLIFQSVVVLLALAQLSRSLEVSDFYDFERSVRLENGAGKSEFVKLDTPINFFSDIYDHIYINTQGILTFGTELNGFLNEPFPLEYAAIAPFYSNVDTAGAGQDTSISFSKITSERNTRLAYETVRRNFAVSDNFRVVSVLVATWENVGHYRENNTEQNTFQVAIICGDQDTFVEFLYPSNGLNWLQGDQGGESGLPDIRAQVGFIAEDGRFFTVVGSGTDNAKYLSELSNHGRPGSWIFRVGHIGFEKNIEQPDQSRFFQQEAQHPRSCASGGKLKCHISAICRDTRLSFDCQCKHGFYGNGFNCIKNDVPLRVAGQITGKINNTPLKAQLQSYVVLSDGRTYTAISPLDNSIGQSSQLLWAFGYGIGWLFAKPLANDNAPNGYQLTGGNLNHTTTIRFTNADGSNNELLIVERFTGLNVWDQLAVEIEVNGNLPEIASNAVVALPDTSDNYQFLKENQIQSAGSGEITVNDQTINYTVNQVIDFETFREQSGEPLNTLNTQPFFNKVSKITAQYQDREAALRIGMINKVVRNSEVNPCTDGTATCNHENSVCVPDKPNDSYLCECKNGFYYDDAIIACVDIDECATNENICDQNAVCFNDLGGYSCRCQDGFFGNGYTCYEQVTQEITEEPIQSASTAYPTPNIPGLAPEHWLCDQCSEHADCIRGVCVCKNGWNGNGVECVYNCRDDSVWNIDRCELINVNSEEEEAEIAPFCDAHTGCTCATGYELIETIAQKICRLIEKEETSTEDEEDKLPCDAESNCHENAECNWIESELRNKCVCKPGYEGDGYECVEREISCLFENICDVNAQCVYDEIVGKSVCKCNKKYDGDGKSCQLVPECAVSEECTENSYCSNGVCVCNEGYERDVATDVCVLSGYCGGTFCAKNAVCLLDNIQGVQYCSCPEGFVGDGLTSCKSVPPPCNRKNNCGLNAQCIQNENGAYECACNQGFYGDGFICILEINCANTPSLCHEKGRCVSTKSGYQCVCNAGYIGNGTYCIEPIRQESAFLLLSQGVAIVKIPSDGNRVFPIAMSGMAIGIDKDCSTGRAYWSDISSKQIFSSRYDGSDKKSFISEDVVSPEGIAIDWISRRIYWTDSSKDTIEVASLDDPKQRSVVVKGNLVNPRGIAVDPHQNKLYWSDWDREHPKIEQSDLDGTNRVILLEAPKVVLPNSLSISSRTGELCYADAGTQKIECIEPYHRSLRTIATNLQYPFGLTVTADRFYWTDWTTKKIESSDEHGSRYSGIVNPLFGNHKMYGVAAVTSDCPLFFSQCQINNGDCPSDSICLINPNAPNGRFCKPISTQ
ncbi:nidogen [Contarinia nasturtii]|uniref:nidogen n=1 Tax=Contarinia nasturtii TaxID=265458 RepID=UPI0012D47CCC|nr:nidogen [Contarinia nasturtii]